MKIGYESWEEAKQAILYKASQILDIGKEVGVTRITFEFDVDYNLLPTVEYTVRKTVLKEDADGLH